MFVLLLVGLVLTLLPLGASATNLAANGGFETGDFTDWTLTGPFACVGSNIGCEPPGYTLDADPGPHTGLYAAYLGGSGPDNELSQTLATTPTQAYTLGFFLAAPSFAGSYTPNSFTVQWDGSDIGTIVNLVSDAYVEYTYSVTGTGTDILNFDSSDQPAAFVLDDVSVTAVPEPGVLGLFGLSFAAMAWRRYRAGHVSKRAIASYISLRSTLSP
jgi:PEP-CTERM motif